MATITLMDIVGTEANLELARTIFKTDKGNSHSRVREEIVKPRMAAINARAGQENDPDYMAYLVEYMINRMN